MGFFDSLKDIFKREEKTAAQRYRDLVRAVADDKPPSAEAAREILRAANKSADDLATDAETLTKRREAFKVYQAGRGIEGEKQQIRAKVDAAAAKHQAAVAAAEAEWRAVTDPLAARERQLDQLAILAANAEAFLHSTDPEHAELERQIRELRAEEERRRRDIAKAVKPWGTLDRDAKELRSNAHATTNDGMRMHPDPTVAIAKAEALERQASAIEHENDRLMAPVNELRSQIAALQTQLETVREP